MAGFSEFLFGTPEQTKEVQLYTPQQQNLQKQLLQMLGPQLQQQFGNKDSFAPIEAQARSGFEQRTIPSIMERFAASNSLESSALPQMLGGAGADLETGLGALRSQHGFNEKNQLMQLLGMGMGHQFEPMYSQRQPGLFEAGASTAMPGGLSALMQLLRMMF